ncbi:uncharacterized protein LOC111687634 isoform X2 [Lucilia cuprina]|uniref:uncharacterized protein LOC111687634 isoform X2 n=1 Tax=Lucilia cuprina TaxID=7375 RepID=UPI001F05A590|nr:uncharacterized protein LOC111687634 isoform X2 [Lucilia cuprina]
MSGKRLTSERLRDRTSYGLYCVNFHGSGLNTIKDEFKRQALTGLRQTLFIVDLDELQKDLNNQPRNSKMRKELKENFNNYLIKNLILQIQGFRKEYELLIKKINEELKFNLYEYWLKHIEENNKISLEPKLKDTNKQKLSNTNKELKTEDKIPCAVSLLPQEHNRVGQPKLISTRKYIKDEPTLGKLYIIILGEMCEEFYKDLLRRDQPLEGIINFIPTESNYDIMLGNNKLRNFIVATLATINFSIYQMRQEISLKPVGLFNHELPVISNCLATKYCREIYDQLTWSIYDIDMLRQQYELFYYKPFQLIDVQIPANVNLTELYYKAESLCIKGNFQNSISTISGTDLSTIAVYLNSLLNTCGWSESEETSSKFSSIIKISKFERLIMDDNNTFLLNMLQNVEPSKYDSLYLSCLDYNMLKTYSVFRTPKSFNNDEENFKTINLPKYVKYYANSDCSQQRITELIKQYDDYQIQEIAPGYKLYTFKRSFNVLNEVEDRVIIPTRLCFRDFTLFQMKEFLQNLNTPSLKPELYSDTSLQEKKVKTLEFDENIFIRPNSLKALKLQKETAKEENKSRKSDYSNRSKSGKKSSLAKSSTKSENSIGLPQDHHLLKGYNLEDTLQEVKYKISKYYYQKGYVQLYEEKWCFQDMNKQITLALNNTTIFFNGTRHLPHNISNNIRLISPNNISIRILNNPEEFSKIVMYYPNGLSVFYHDTYCEQIWYCDDTPRKEERRIYTNLGAIIVFFKSNDLIMIMRYNGEIYKLYQHELAEEEEEQGHTSELGEVQEKSSGYIDIKAQGDSIINKGDTFEHKSKQSKKSRNTLKSCINYELNFLNLLCSIYDLKYLHLIVTTSQGRRINMTHQGNIFEGPHCSLNEWHDYYANESYCERSDGVKMIWSSDYFKCFHKDGSSFKTTIENIFEKETDEFESQISQSSSHDYIKDEMEDEIQDKSKLGKNLKQKELSFGGMPFTFINHETVEEHISSDLPFITYHCKSFFMQHPNYAEVYILNPELSNFLSLMEIFGKDDIRIYIHREPSYIDEEYLRSEGEEYTNNYTNFKTIVNVWIGENLNITADNEVCEVYAVMSESQVVRELKSDSSLTLRLKYTDCINDAFKYLVNEIALLEGSKKQKTEKLYYIEKLNSDCSRRGFEFYASPPVLSHYNFTASNNITEFKPVTSIQELMTNNCEYYHQELNKFPRFKQAKKKKLVDVAIEFPQLLSANIFIKIPQQLRSTANITNFLEPFEKIDFKKLRSKFKNVLNFYMKPQQQEDLKIFSSLKNWSKRHWEHKRRLFTEQQRLSLYHAMIKHKMYPNYWKFSKAYECQVCRIEFFDFMQNKCEKKEIQGQE